MGRGFSASPNPTPESAPQWGGDDELKNTSKVPSTRKQIFKRQLGVVGSQMTRTGAAWDIQCFAHGVEMKTDDARSQTHGRNASLLSHATHGGLAHLKDFGELLGGKKFFAIGHTQISGPSLKTRLSRTACRDGLSDAAIVAQSRRQSNTIFVFSEN